jgi:TPP-dependent pyruvate/acetoin dehydrogenase alpha subunit
VDVGVKRSLVDIENWKARDPITRLSFSMMAEGLWNQNQENELNKGLDVEIKAAWEKAMNDPYPNLEATLKYVYSGE